MTLTAFTMRYMQLAGVIFLLLMTLGIAGFLTIPRAADPNVALPNVIITIVLPGAAAPEMEESIAKPIEQAVQGLDDIREVRSSSTDGFARIIIDFDYGTDADKALDRVSREVSKIRPSLPQGIVRFDFERSRSADVTLLQIALIDNGSSPRRMEKYAHELRDVISPIPGVRNVLISGLDRPEVQILLNSDKLAEANIQPLDVSHSVAAAGSEIAAGAVHVAEQRFNLSTAGAFRDIDAIAHVPLVSGFISVFTSNNGCKILECNFM